MQNIDYDLISIMLGISMILSCCAIAYIFQTRYFSKYRYKVKNATKKRPDS